MQQSILLVAAVVAVGVLHTMVPDHWAPIALLARTHGWSTARTARAAAIAGVGHTLSTLLIAALVWGAGAVLAVRYGHAVELLSGIALVLFGGWIALRSAQELRHAHDDHAGHVGHAHLHRHADGAQHRHWHVHSQEDWHEAEVAPTPAPLHEHAHETSQRTALLLILGSSPMIEGIPAFFAAGRYGVGLLAIMAVFFAASTIATYVGLCLASASGMERINLGRFEEYGEVISGSFIALLGIVLLSVPSL